MENPLNKNEIIEKIAEGAEISKVEAARALKAFIDVITRGLAEGKKINLATFGSLEVKHREARMGRNPQTGESIEIKASNTISYKAAKALKDAVNGTCIMEEEV